MFDQLKDKHGLGGNPAEPIRELRRLQEMRALYTTEVK